MPLLLLVCRQSKKAKTTLWLTIVLVASFVYVYFGQQAFQQFLHLGFGSEINNKTKYDSLEATQKAISPSLSPATQTIKFIEATEMVTKGPLSIAKSLIFKASPSTPSPTKPKPKIPLFFTTIAPPQTFCSFVNVDPFDPAVAKHLHWKNKTPLDCSKGLPSLVYLDGDILRINATKVEQTIGSIDYCKYSPIELSDVKDDSYIRSLKWSTNWNGSIQLSSKDEHLVIQCYLNNTLVGVTYKSRITEKLKIEKKRQKDHKRHIEENSPLETLSILIVGIDGMSKQNLIRTMPNTRNYIIDHLNARELNKFNKVGDNTFPNVLVFQSGQNESDISKRWNRKVYFEEIDDIFLWHHYQKAGYRTTMMFDVTGITAFHYLKEGWKRPPFDYYSRALNLGLSKGGKPIRKGGSECVGDIPELVVLQDYLLQLTAKFNSTKNKNRPYFSYSFFTGITHYDHNLAKTADHIYLNFFKQLNKANVLNNTLVIFFSDHGTRFYSFRHTINGKIEVNTPYVFLMFPPWFEKKYPEVMNTFGINQNRLTTFFDLNKTLMDLLKFKGKTKKGSLKSRAISLFDEIPKERTCVHAAIPMDYCNCKQFSSNKIPFKVAQDLSKQLVDFIREKTSKRKDKCAMLSLKTVYSILAITTKKGSQEPFYYQTTIETKPGGAVYEALMKYDMKSRKASLIGNIVRLNLYREQAGCVNTLDLKPYCFCKS